MRDDVTMPAESSLANAEWQLCMNLASAAFTVGELEHARECLLRASRAAGSFPETDERIARTLNMLAVLDYRTGRLGEAASGFEQAAAALEKTGAANGAAQAMYLANLAAAQARLGSTGEAELTYMRAIEIGSGADAPEMELAWGFDSLASLQCDASQYEVAMWNLRRSLDLKGTARTWDLAITLEKLALCLRGLNRNLEAENLLREALQTKQSLVGPDDPALSSIYVALSQLYLEQRKFAESEQSMCRALIASYPEGGAAPPDLEVKLSTLAGICREAGMVSKVERVMQLAALANQGRLSREHLVTVLDSLFPGNRGQ